MFFIAKDGVKIAADFYNAENPAGWCVLIHMMPAVKESWRDFAMELQKYNYESLAIDLRGHGESDFGPNGYLDFSDEKHQKGILDLEAAIDYLIKEKRAIPDKIILIGASIGANLALQYIQEHPEFKAGILLSPGLNYYGIETEPLVKNLKSGQKVFFISSKDDERSGGNNAEMNQKLYDLTPVEVKRKIQIYETAGHGTDILKNNQELTKVIINFIS